MTRPLTASAPRTPGSRWTRLRAGLGLLAVAVPFGLGVQDTFAFWTDNAVINGGTFTSGTLDIKVDGADNYSTTTLGMTGMAPGSTSAEVLTIGNGGTVPLKYTLTGGLTGTNAAIFNTGATLSLTIMTGATRSGTGNAAVCTGGTTIYTGALTSTVTTAILAKRPTTAMAPGGSEALCFQVTFLSTADNTTQNLTAAATFTASATSDLS